MLDKPDFNPDYLAIYAKRQKAVLALRANPQLRAGAAHYYREHRVEFVNDWCDTVDPRNAGTNRPVTMPFVLFPRQVELVDFIFACIAAQANGMIVKSRDMGATWTACAVSVLLWLFWDGASVGWGSRKSMLVDRLGDMDSIFEKIRYIIKHLPIELLPAGFSYDNHMNQMRILNPLTTASITGEGGDDIGRGGRKLVYFKDESAHYEHPEMIEAALSDNTNCQIDISSVHGLGTVFHRRYEAGVHWHRGMKMRRGETYVFEMDWRDHPYKDQAWYDRRKAKAIDEGLFHVFSQEVDRNFAASIEGTIIPAEWIASAIDAHKQIPGLDTGGWSAALDVADEGGDLNALAKRKGVVLRFAEDWGAKDTGVTARKAVDYCREHGIIQVQYDCIGVGSGVKSETNRLQAEGLMPKHMRFIPWDAGGAVQDPEERVIPKDIDSPLNKDFYTNLKAQGWWMLRRRFERTHRAITEGVKYDPDDLISLDSALPRLRQIQKELSQPTASKSARLKLLVDKKPDGSRSPNIADAIMMCYWPVKPGSTYDSTFAWVG